MPRNAPGRLREGVALGAGLQADSRCEDRSGGFGDIQGRGGWGAYRMMRATGIREVLAANSGILCLIMSFFAAVLDGVFANGDQADDE